MVAFIRTFNLRLEHIMNGERHHLFMFKLELDLKRLLLE